MTHSYIKLGDDIVNSDDIQNIPENKALRNAWVWDSQNQVIEYDKSTLIDIISDHIAAKKNGIILSGITWRSTPLDNFNTIKLTRNMSDFLDRTQEAISHSSNSRPNIHGGVLFQDGSQFNINDAGIVELAVFAYSWGLKISQIANGEISSLSGKTTEQLLTYDCADIDWTVTWGATDIANGWLDNTLTQTP